MASVLSDYTLSKSKFLNWIKAALAVHFTKEEIEPVVQDEIEQFQRRCLQDIYTTNGLPVGSTCTTCNTENLIVCLTDRICNAKRGKCKYHRRCATQYRPSGCPNKICNHMKSEIQKAHRFHGPSYQNTDATKWCNDTWEIAKCYLPPDGYTNVSSAAETDFNGIISVIINHKEFEAKIKDDLSKKGSIFDKGRDVGKAVRHSPNLEVEDTDLSQYFTILNDILTDPGFIALNKSSNKAIQKLTKLEADDLIIGKDVLRKVLEDVGKTVQEQIQNEIDEFKKKTEKQKLELIGIIVLKVKYIEDKGHVSFTKLNETLKSCVDLFNAKVQKPIQEIENQTEKGKQKQLETTANEKVEKLTKKEENFIKEVQKAGQQRPSYNDANAKMSEETYQKQKEGFRKNHIRSTTRPSVMMAAESIDPEMEIWRRVLDKTWGRVKKYLIPDPIIDLKTEYELFTFVERRDIKEERNTTEKNEAILKKVRSKGINGYREFIKRLKMANQCKLADLLTYTEEGKDSSEIEQQLDVMVEETLSEYNTLKSKLKKDLLRFYKMNHSKVLLSPLFEEKDTPLASFYIRPELSVNTLQDMFKTEGVANREIYLEADAGLGKTTFSKYLATSWYQAHCPDEKDLQYFEKNDIDCMRDFDFVFLVLLRDSNTSCSVDELIFKLIVSKLANSKSFTEEFVEELMSCEKCLVILDGLDEWTHPKTPCERGKRSIPHRNDRENCTILTTTRPWRLGDLNLSSNELGKTVELTKLSYKSAGTLIRRSLKRLKSPPHNMPIQIDDHTLEEEIFDSPVAHLGYVPLLLMYMICLRCEGFNIGNSKCELYVKIVELLLLRTTQKYGDISQTLSSSGIPACFAKLKKCKEYFTLLVKLGQLAYHTLSKKTRGNTLVFDESVTGKYLTSEEMKFILHSGILSQSTTTKLTENVIEVSFSHKTFQEFFAAIFVSFKNEDKKIVLEKCRNIQDILDMSIIYEFIIEMYAARMCDISNDLMSVINEDGVTRDYRTGTNDEDLVDCNPLYNIQKMFMSFLQKMPESENIQLCLQDFFIDGGTVHSEQLQRLLKQNKTNIKSLFIDKKNTSSSLREIIDLFSLTDLSHIQKLYYCCDSRYREKPEIDRMLFPSLQYVYMCGVEWTNDEENMIGNLARLKKLQYLHIHGCMLSHKILETFFHCISGNTSMKELTLCGLYFTEHGCQDSKRWNLDLSQHSTLSQLDLHCSLPGWLHLDITTPSLVYVTLGGIRLDESSLLLSGDMLNIKRVELFNTYISARSLQKFITVLENLPQSVIVKMELIYPSTEHVRDYVWSSQTFLVIEDRFDCIYDRFVFVTMKNIAQLTEEITSILKMET